MDSISIKFFLKDNAKLGTLKSIYGRLIINRKKSEFATGFKIESNKWNNSTNTVKKSGIIKQELLDIENNIYKIIRRFVDNHKTYSPKDIINVLKNKGEVIVSTDLIEFYEKELKEMIDKDESAESTIRHYQGTLKIIIAYKKHNKLSELKLQSLSYSFIKDIDYYMSAVYISPYDKKIKRNTINKHHARIKAIINFALKERIIDHNPYEQYKFKYDKSKREYLSEEELNNIQLLDLSNNSSLEKVRDIFIFSCNTGIRFQDAQDLTFDDIKHHKKNGDYFEFQITKTSEIISLPIIKQAQLIIDKYESHQDRLVQGKILPQISNQKFNMYIKHIATLSGIDKKISHHIARHTFATIALNRGISIVTVQKLLGHTTVRTTEIYAKLLQETIFNEMEKME